MTRRIAVLECEDAQKWEGYTELLWKDSLREPGDSWTLYRACDGHLPSAEEAAQFDALIVAGSHYSAYEEHEWIRQLLELLQKLAVQGTRMYGCCFGCQILARALGGSIGPNPDGNFVLTIEQIQPTAGLQNFPKLHAAVQQALAAGAATGGSNSIVADAAAATSVDHRGSISAAAAAIANGLGELNISSSAASADVSIAACGEVSSEAATAAAAVGDAAGHAAARAAAAAGCFRLIESHGDQVLQLPPGAALLASSGTATNELWCWGNNILASQFHVEFDEPLVIEKIWTSLKDVGRLDAQQAEHSRQVLEAGGQMNAAMLQVIKHFLKHGIDRAAAPNMNGSTDNFDTGGSSGKAPSSSNSSSNSNGSTTTGPVNDSSNGSSSNYCDGADGSSSSGQSAAAPIECTAFSTDAIEPEQQLQLQHAGAVCDANTDAAAAQSEPLRQATSGSSSLPPGSASAAADATSAWPPYLEPNFSIRAERESKSLTGLSDAAESGCSSPTAASEYSVAASITSTSSAIPFSHIAYQRKQQKRELELHDNAKRMVNDASAAFDLRMDNYCLDFELLQQLNASAADQYMVTAEIAAALGQFAQDLGGRQAALREALAALPQIDRQLKMLEATVSQLDKRSRQLEAQVGAASGSSSSKSAYDYLTASFTRMGSAVGDASAGGCLGGGVLPKQFE